MILSRDSGQEWRREEGIAEVGADGTVEVRRSTGRSYLRSARVAVMQTTEVGQGNDCALLWRLDRSGDRRIAIKR